MLRIAAAAVLVPALLVSACSTAGGDPTTAESVSELLNPPSQGWTLDRPTEDWFSTWCSGVDNLGAVLNGPAEEMVSALTGTGDRLVTLSAELGSMPVPTFDGASGFATDRVTELAVLGRTFHEAASLWDDGHTDSAQALVDAGVQVIDPTFASLDPVVTSSIRALPACQSVRLSS